MNRRAFFAALAAAVVAPKAAKPRVISEEELTERYFRPAVEASIRQFEATHHRILRAAPAVRLQPARLPSEQASRADRMEHPARSGALVNRRSFFSAIASAVLAGVAIPREQIVVAPPSRLNVLWGLTPMRPLDCPPPHQPARRPGESLTSWQYRTGTLGRYARFDFYMADALPEQRMLNGFASQQLEVFELAPRRVRTV
jgi:hypothetical protein